MNRWTNSSKPPGGIPFTARRHSSQFSLLRGSPPGGASPTARRHTNKDTPLLVYTLAEIFMHIQPLNLTSRSLVTNIYNTTIINSSNSQAFNQVKYSFMNVGS